MRAGVVDEDAPHHLSGDPEKMRAVLPVLASLIDQTHVRLVDQCRGLKGVVPALLPYVAPGHPMQFAVDDLHQPAFRLPIARSQAHQ